MPIQKCTRIPGISRVALCSILFGLGAGMAQAATPAQGRIYLSMLSGSLQRIDYQYDGGSSLIVSAPNLITTLSGGGGVRLGADDQVYVVSIGNVSRVNPDNGTVTSVSATNNANTVSFDPDGLTLWAGWKDTPLASVPISPLASGTTHVVSGDDNVASTVVFTPAHGTFYTTGGELESGNFGRIDMDTFVTQRLLGNAHATGAIYDPFSGHLIVTGLGRAKQIAPANPASVLSSRDDSASGENYLVLQPDGRGHLFGTRFGPAARLVMIDYSASGLIGGAGSVMLSVPIPGIDAGLSGEAAVDANSIFKSGFEASAQ
jgi:hypothetical protein